MPLYRHTAFVGLLPGSRIALVGGETFADCMERVRTIREISGGATRLTIAWAQDCRPVTRDEALRLQGLDGLWVFDPAGYRLPGPPQKPLAPAIVRSDFAQPAPFPEQWV